MKVTVKVDVDTAAIMRRRGLGGDNRAQIYLASQVKDKADPYVPMQSGFLKNNAKVSSDGSTLTYPGPYAHYLYKGEVMGPNWQDKSGKWHSGKAPKKYTGRELTYHGGPMRGKEWVPRMLADKSEEITRDLKTHIGRLSK